MSETSELSGAISGLEVRIAQLEVDVVQFPTTTDFNSLSALGTSRYNTVDSSMEDVLLKLAGLETYITNLRMYVLALERRFTGHTGVAAASGHNGLTG